MFYIKPPPKTASFKRFLRHILHAFLHFLLEYKKAGKQKNGGKTMNFRNLSFLLLVTALILSVSFVAAKSMRPEGNNGQGEPQKDKCMNGQCRDPSVQPLPPNPGPGPCEWDLKCICNNLRFYEEYIDLCFDSAPSYSAP